MDLKSCHTKTNPSLNSMLQQQSEAASQKSSEMCTNTTLGEYDLKRSLSVAPQSLATAQGAPGLSIPGTETTRNRK